MYTLVTTSLNVTYTWTAGVIKMSDYLFRIYVRAKFGNSVAFHVATWLMRILFLEAAKPRHQVCLSLRAADNQQTAKVILLATLRSLDVMQEIQRLNFINHPSVSNKLVKFLAVNTEFQSVINLQGITTSLTTDINQIKKDNAGQLKTL